jgi:Holliday junction resolvase
VRRAAKVDKNHPEIVAALRKVGCEVLSLARVGEGVPDLLVRTRGGRLLLLEVKDGSKAPSARRLTIHQRQFHDVWRPCCRVVESVDEALREVML